VRVGVALDIEALGSVEHAIVVVGCVDHDEYAVATAQAAAVQGVRLLDDAHGGTGGPIVTQHFLDG
jgi:hypothetical protein